MAKRVIFLGSKPIGYQCLKYLIQEREALDVDIVGVISNKRKEFDSVEDPGQLAVENNISLYNHLDELPECDIIYSVQYHEILKQHHIDKARQIAVNLHMAPLPEYRGSNQFSIAIIEGKTEFGTTIHRIDTRIDHGEILFQKRFPIPENCWVEDLYKLTFEASVRLFQQTLKHIVNGNYQLLPQQLLEAKYGTSLHYRNEAAKLKEIDPTWDKEKIDRYVRAMSMPGFEPPYAMINGTKVYFTRQ
jgi:methionyl-tRNA formyltransferase